MNTVRLPIIQSSYCARSIEGSVPFNQKRILEVGCGGGVLTEELAKIGGIVHGIDPCSEVVTVAKQHATLNPGLTNLAYYFTTIEKQAQHNSEEYDVVIASEVIEHVTEKVEFLKNCIKCLKPGGSIIITTFNKTTSSWLYSIIILQEILNYIPRGTHTWDKFISPEELSIMLDSLNCTTLEVKGMNFNIINKRWSISSNINNSYCLEAVKNFKTSTVDKSEIDHFKALSSIWWNEETILHTMNKLRVPFIQNGLSNSSTDISTSFEDKLILEVGCGAGVLSEDLAKLGGAVHGIDPSPETIAVAKQHASLNEELSNLKYSVDTIENYALHNFEKYDAIVASEVLEHITNKEVFLEACIKCLKPGGKIFITTFNQTIISWLYSVIILQEILNIIPRGTHAWKKFISPEDVATILQKNNCKTVEVKGLSVNCVTGNWRWTSSLSNSYALQAVKLK
ncbi:hypothetical protein FQR65_LT06905 [Abscondita terminalis]|nr:hypothetical protein FQR65_LT06905 [Abscondita terminalis]